MNQRPEPPDFEAISREDKRRIARDVPGLTPEQLAEIGRWYDFWVQRLWHEGAKQLPMAGRPIVTLEVDPDLRVGRNVMLRWEYGGKPAQLFGRVYMLQDFPGHAKVMYKFDGFGYSTDAQVAIEV